MESSFRRWEDEEKVAVLVPALNEADTLPSLIRRLVDGGLPQILVVDNGSTDDTAEVAARAGARVTAEGRRGYGATCLRGLDEIPTLFPWAEVVVFVDADQGGDLEAIRAVLSPVLEGEAELGLGVRLPVSGRSHVLAHARLGNRLVLGLVRLFFGAAYRDLPPLRAVRLESLARLRMDDRDWGWTLQMQIRAAREGLRVREVPVPHHPRRAGESKISGSLIGSVRAGRTMILTVFRERLRPWPPPSSRAVEERS